MPLLGSLLQRRKPEVFSPIPEKLRTMPVRPFRILHAGLPFYSDSKCQNEIQNARLVILQCVDPIRKLKEPECMPSRKHYEQGQTVNWDLNNKLIWESAWYRNPDTGRIEKAWTQSVEFVGKVVAPEVVASASDTEAPKRQASVSQSG